MPLSDRYRKCDLGSPVRETRTPGSAWGDGFKEPCRLGEGHCLERGSSGEAPQRLPLQGLSLPAIAFRTQRSCGASRAASAMGRCCISSRCG